MKLIVVFLLFAAFALVLFGWGWAARRLLHARRTTWPATIASGVAALVVTGGVLNLSRIAYPWAFACLAAIGAVMGIVALAKDRPSWPDGASQLILLILAAGVLAFVVETQVPPRAYNFHDDYQKYFGHVARMVETGAVFGSPLNDIGLDTLGGQAFLDGFVVAFFPIRYINAIDSGFGFFACMMLASTFIHNRKHLFPIAVLCLLSVVIINPQYVNTSALYMGALLIMAVIEEEGISAPVTGLLCAALVALKSTFVLFVAVEAVAALLARGWKWTGIAIGAFLAFLSPWILVHAPHYVAFLGGNPSGVPGQRASESFNIFSAAPLDYGSSPANYSFLMLAIVLSGMIIAIARRKIDMTAASCFAVGAAYLIMVYISGPRNAGYEQAVRYFTAFAIGAAPAAFGTAAVVLDEVAGSRWWRLGVPLVLGAGPVLAFSPSLVDRAKQAVHSGSELAFSWLAPDSDYLAYSQEVLYGDMRQRVTAAQAQVPPGDEVVVWINTPFYLNYARNPIADIEPGAGLIAPWSKLPAAHYFIWQYDGYANTDEAAYARDYSDGPDLLRLVTAARAKMASRFDEMMHQSEKVYDDGGMAVFRR